MDCSPHLLQPRMEIALSSVRSNDYRNDTTIPVIDVSAMYSGRSSLEERQDIAKRVRQACHDLGFFMIINHGIDQEHEKQAFEQAHAFFSLPLARKMEIHNDLVAGGRKTTGYMPLENFTRLGRKKKDLSEWFDWRYDPEDDPLPEAERKDYAPVLVRNIWPSAEHVPAFRSALTTFYQDVSTFARHFTRIIAMALHLPEDHFEPYMRPPTARMRIIRYPAQETPRSDQDGLGAHRDYGVFSIITQNNVGALEILDKNGHWVFAAPIEGAIVVNVADCLMRMTDGFFTSATHRVKNSGQQDRLSIPFFLGWHDECLMKRVCDEQGNVLDTEGRRMSPSPRYPEITVKDYIFANTVMAEKLINMDQQMAEDLLQEPTSREDASDKMQTALLGHRL